MLFVIEETLEIDAPAELVWEVITDVKRYPEWNPFQVEMQTSFKPGDPMIVIYRQMSKNEKRVTAVAFPGSAEKPTYVNVTGYRILMRSSPAVNGICGDPTAYTTSLLIIVVSCVLAAAVPALRAARIDPIATLRQD